MRQCPRCKNEVPDYAKICPHCGYRLDTKYKPMKRRKTSAISIFYIVIAFLFMFSPTIISYLINDGQLTSNSIEGDTGETIRLGKLGDVKNEKEYMEYQFDDLDIFNKRVEGVKPTVKKIKNFEKKINKITDKPLEKQYDIIITDLNNIYYDILYTINLSKEESIKIHLYYDIGKVENEAHITYYQKGKESFKEIMYQEDTHTLMESYISLLTDTNSKTIMDDTGEKFNALDTEFEQRKEALGHYGIGVDMTKKNDVCRMYVNGYVDNYTVKVEYQTKLNLKQFV